MISYLTMRVSHFIRPVMLILMLVVGFGLRMALPLSFLPGEMVWIAGLTIVVSAFGFFFWAVFTMRQGGGSIPTGKPTDVILSNGPYRFSRNPIYASMIVLVIGVGIWANSLWFIGFARHRCFSAVMGCHLSRGSLPGAKICQRLCRI